MHKISHSDSQDEVPISCSIRTKGGIEWSGLVQRSQGILSDFENAKDVGDIESSAQPCIARSFANNKIQDVENLTSLVLRLADSADEAPAWIRSLSSLTKLDFSGAVALKRLPHGTDRLLALSELNLRGCVVLQRLPSSILALSSSLTILNLSDCAALRELPTDLGRLTALRDLCLRGCRRLRELPPSAGALARLLRLDMSDTDLRAVPAEAAAGLTSLRKLSLRDCRRLRELPPGLAALAALEQLHLAGCTDLRRAPPFAPLAGLQARPRRPAGQSRCTNRTENRDREP